jgi:hypothetical protein
LRIFPKIFDTWLARIDPVPPSDDDSLNVGQELIDLFVR